MQRITDRLLLFFYCIIHVSIVSVNISFVTGLFFVLSLSSLTYFFDAGKCSFYITLLYGILALPIPMLYFFLPVILYDILQYKARIPLLVVSIGAFIYLSDTAPLQIAVILMGCTLTFALQKKSQLYEELSKTFTKTRDDSTELYLLLEEKNQTILEQQDYEIYTATLRERNRIAREIHDNVGHLLSRSILMLGAVKAINKEAVLKPSLAQLDDTLSLAMNSIRESVHDLHDRSLNLKDTLEGLTDSFTFCPVQLDYDMGLEVPREIKYSFVAIIKEALSNVIKHSNATRVYIVAREHPGLFQLSVADNGTNKASETTGSGIGLVNMKERVSLLKGNIQLSTENGFRIFITIPKERI